MSYLKNVIRTFIKWKRINDLFSCFVLIIVLPSYGLAQIDSTLLEFFPLHQGDTLQYTYGNEFGFTSRVITQLITNPDTVLSNGRHYFKIMGSPYKSSTKYLRIDSLLRVQEYSGFYSSNWRNGEVNSEVNVFRLNERAGTSWNMAYNLGDQLTGPPYIIRYNGIYLTTAFETTHEIMDFQQGVRRASSGDTTYSYHFLLLKGFGIYRIEYGENLWLQLTGATINGIRYGKLVTDVKEEPSVPSIFTLEQNYPNPFNPTTRISFSIPTDELTIVKVYDIIGREMATLVNGYQKAGCYIVSFDAAKLSSGIYIYKIQAGSYSAMKKMQLVK